MSKKGSPMDNYFQLYNLFRIASLNNLEHKIFEINIEDIEPSMYFPETLEYFLGNYKNNQDYESMEEIDKLCYLRKKNDYIDSCFIQ